MPTKERAVRIQAPGGPEALELAEVTVGEPGPGRNPHPPPRLRRQLHRRLPSHRPVPAAAAARARHGRRRHRRGGRRRRHAPEGRRPRRLREPAAGRLRHGARHAGEVRRQAARRDRLRDRRRDDAQGPDRAVPAAQDAAAGRSAGGRLRAVPCRGRRRRPDRVPVGEGARPAADRHGRLDRQVRAGAGARRRATRSTTRPTTSSPASRRSPAARASRSSTTASARTPSRSRSTACGRSGCWPASAMRRGRCRRSASACSARRARCT